MALHLRFRRAAALSSSILRGRSLFTAIAPVCPPPPSLPVSDISTASSSSPQFRNVTLRPYALIQSVSFRASAPFFDRRSDGGEDKKFGPDDILFEGCDYNHWLITMDFPKDPAPTREEMIETYIQTLAKVVGSVEEAKKRMYALSTTTYHGFQAVMTEEMSEKFHVLPGVVFVLPDSYIDPVNKEYGGDKYENGVITPRPPPIQYGRQGRPRNQNRNDRPNYNRPPSQGNMSYGQQDFGQGEARNYPPPQGNSRSAQDGRGYGAYEGRDFVHPGERRDIGRGEQRNYAQAGGRYSYQGDRRDPMPSYPQDFNQGARSNFIPHEQRNFSQDLGGDNRFTGPSGYGDVKEKSDPGYASDFGQGMGSGPSGGYVGESKQFGNSGYNGEYNQGSGYASNYRQQPPPAHGQTNSTPSEGPTGPWQGRT